jgi:Skp family chaperone for outer membrane proteins
MRTKIWGLALACAASTIVTGQALAQTQPAAAPAAALPTGTPIPGLCVLNRDQLIEASTVGKYVQQRLLQLKAQVGAELSTDQQALETEHTTLQSQQATLTADQRDQRVSTLNAHVQAFQAKEQQREAELQKTAEKAYSRVIQESEPLIEQAYAQHSCSVLLNAEAVMLASNRAMDLSQQVVDGLNGKITQFAFEREQIAAQPAAPAGQ